MASIEDALNQPRRAGEPGYEGGEPSSRKIQSDIDRTRSNMDRTFDAIESKLTPGQLLQEAWGIFKGGSGAGASKVMKIAKQHPLPSAVIGLGIGWLLLDSSRATSQERSRQSYSGNLDYPGTRDAWSERWPESRESEGEGRLGVAKDALKSAAGSAADLATNAKEKVSDLASQAGDKLGDLTDKVKEQASELGTKVEQGTRQVRLGFWQLLEERPLAVGAATLAIGLLAGLSIPSTDVEDELMGETRDQLFDSAKETGRELLDKGKHVADAAVDAVQQAAEDQNLSVDSLSDKVKTVANQAKEAVKTEARNQHLTPETPAADAGEQAQAKPGQPQGQPAQKATQPSQPQGAKPEVREPELVKR